MRKSLLTVVATCIAVSASAAGFGDVTRNAARTPFANAVKANKTAVRKSPRTNAPQGEVKPYAMACNGFYLYDGLFVSEYTDQGYASQVVFTDDAKICLYDLMTCLPSLSYLEVSLPDSPAEGENNLTVTLPQQYIVDEEIAAEYGFDGPIYLRMLDAIKGFDGEYELSKNQNLELVYNTETGVISMELDESRIIGLCDEDGEWLGYGLYEFFYTPFTDVEIELPETAVVESWACVCDGQGRMVKVAFDGNDVYLGGLYGNLENNWVKGSIEGDKVKFASEQYIGYDVLKNHYAYFLGGAAEEYYDEDWEDWVVVVLVNEYFTMAYDAEARVMNAGDEFIIINGGVGNFYFLDYLMRPVFRYQDGYSQSAPANPEIVQFDAPSGGYPGGVVFEAAEVDKDGALLDSDRMYFRLFGPDLEVITFTPEQHILLTEPMSVFPLNFMDSPDGYGDFSVFEGMHVITLYDDAITKIGVQIMLLDDNGEWQCSDIVCSDGRLIPAGVAEVSDSAVVESSEWFGMNGMKIARPAQPGIYLRVDRLSDGTIRTAKILVK